MKITQRGKVLSGGIALQKPLDLAEGTEVIVQVETLEQKEKPSEPQEKLPLLPFFGMWADREDMADSSQWVSEERKQWQQRTNRQD